MGRVQPAAILTLVGPSAGNRVSRPAQIARPQGRAARNFSLMQPSSQADAIPFRGRPERSTGTHSVLSRFRRDYRVYPAITITVARNFRFVPRHENTENTENTKLLSTRRVSDAYRNAASSSRKCSRATELAFHRCLLDIGEQLAVRLAR